MARGLGYQPSFSKCLIQYGLIFLVLSCCNYEVSSCHPPRGLAGTASSVVMQVKRHVNVSVNFHHTTKLLSSASYTLSNDGKSYSLGNNLRAKFYGKEVCLSTTKMTVINERGANQRKHASCERVCFDLGRRVTLVTNSSSGGRVWPGQRHVCCIWHREVYLELSLSLVGPQCAICEGTTCLKSNVTTKKCSPGDKCFALTLEADSQTIGETVLPVRLGCTSDSSFQGYVCKDGCRREVEVVGSGKRKLCVHCCTGQGCNKIGRPQKGGTRNSTIITGNLPHKLDRSETEQTGGNLGTGSDLRVLFICVTSMFFSLFLHS